eukprot:TRINITY_DN632_c0_g1_i2.p1 TRINITY_DN632_c0_g1~~TRINITY_DN632_c0_g1_i2.p1  ORF type:complete len:306 (-),score=53.25 TRINITY_DN632_c0_g1_i2:159-1076(-)
MEPTDACFENFVLKLKEMCEMPDDAAGSMGRLMRDFTSLVGTMHSVLSSKETDLQTETVSMLCEKIYALPETLTAHFDTRDVRVAVAFERMVEMIVRMGEAIQAASAGALIETYADDQIAQLKQDAEWAAIECREAVRHAKQNRSRNINLVKLAAYAAGATALITVNRATAFVNSTSFALISSPHVTTTISEIASSVFSFDSFSSITSIASVFSSESVFAIAMTGAACISSVVHVVSAHPITFAVAAPVAVVAAFVASAIGSRSESSFVPGSSESTLCPSPQFTEPDASVPLTNDEMSNYPTQTQ